MLDTFRISGYWGSKAETLHEITYKTLNTLNQLSKEDEQFSNWYEGANSRKKALEKKVIINIENINMLFKEGIKKGELNESGYSAYRLGIGLWSGHNDLESSSVSIYAGGEFDTKNISNCCVLSIPPTGEAKDRLLKLDKVKSIIKIFIQNWDPDVVILNSKYLSNTFDTINEVGWVTYRKELKSIPQLSQNIIYERFNDGHIFYLNTDHIPNYDMMNELQALKQLN